MNIKINQEILQQALNTVSKGVSVKNTMELLKGILFEAYNGRLILTSNNLEIGIQMTIEELEVLEEGRIVIDAKLINDIVRKMPPAEISIHADEHQIINIRCANTNFNIKGFQAQDFPLLPTLSESSQREIDGEIFQEMVRKTSYAAAQIHEKPSYTGELLDIREDSINIVAMDGFRVAMKSQKTDFQDDYAKILVPAKSIVDISRMIPQEEDKITLRYDDKRICFLMKNIVVTSRLLKNDFINYEQIIPLEFSTRLHLKRKDLLEALERASLVSNKNLIKFVIADDLMNISSKNDEIGNLSEDIDILLKGEPLEIAFNAKFFIDCLKVLDEEEILLSFNSPLSPCVVRAAEDESFLYLVLPVRI